MPRLSDAMAARPETSHAAVLRRVLSMLVLPHLQRMKVFAWAGMGGGVGQGWPAQLQILSGGFRSSCWYRCWTWTDRGRPWGEQAHARQDASTYDASPAWIDETPAGPGGTWG